LCLSEVWTNQWLEIFLHCQSKCYLFLHLFQVNDYVKNYIGDGKGPKNFAKDYVERRSKWRNALKSKKKFEDDLLTPAAAINPNNDDEVRNSIFFQFNGFFVRFCCLLLFSRQKSCSAAEKYIFSGNRSVQLLKVCICRMMYIYFCRGLR
jgi:hypothetical protein